MKGTSLISAIALAALTLANGLALAATSSQSDPTSVVREFAAAYNAHDVEAGLALVTEDAVFTFLPPAPPPAKNVYVGKAEIRAWLEEAAANQEHVETSDYQVVGDKVTLFARVTGADLRRAGVDFLEGPTEIVVRQGKIQSFTYTLTDASVAKLQAAATTTHPTGMPATGAGDAGGLLWPLLAVGLLSLALGGLGRLRSLVHD